MNKIYDPGERECCGSPEEEANSFLSSEVNTALPFQVKSRLQACLPTTFTLNILIMVKIPSSSEKFTHIGGRKNIYLLSSHLH